MPKVITKAEVPKPRPVECVACEGCGRNSNNTLCYPCDGTGIQGERNRRVQAGVVTVTRKGVDTPVPKPKAKKVLKPEAPEVDLFDY